MTFKQYLQWKSVGGKEVLQSHFADTVSEGNLDKTQLRVSNTKGGYVHNTKNLLFLTPSLPYKKEIFYLLISNSKQNPKNPTLSEDKKFRLL